MLKKLFILLIVVATIHVAVKRGPEIYRDYFTSIYSAENCRIEISPSFRYKDDGLLKAIEFMRENSPEYYGKMCQYVTAIEATDQCNSAATACAFGGTKIGIVRNLERFDTPQIATLLVHETCHFHQGHTATPESYRDPNYLSGREAECDSEDEKFRQKVGGQPLGG